MEKKREKTVPNKNVRRCTRCNYWPIKSLKTTACTHSPSHRFWRQRSFRRAIASSVHAAAVGSAWPTQILPASDSELRSRRSSGVRLAYTDFSGDRQRAPSTPQQWGPPRLHRSFRRATASTVHAAVGSV